MFGLSTYDKLKRRLEECEESLRRIEHSFKMLQVEWTETYDKFRRLNWKVAKRQKELDLAEAATDSPQGEETRQGGEEPASGFSPSQLEAQRKVMARRHGRSNGKEGS